jgi:hypothetical protein
MDEEFIMISGKDLLSSMQVKSKVNLQACFTQDFGFSLRSSSLHDLTDFHALLLPTMNLYPSLHLTYYFPLIHCLFDYHYCYFHYDPKRLMKGS